MITAAKRHWFSRWFANVAEQRIKRRFRFVHVFGLARLRALAEVQHSVIVVSNHTAWWDPLIALWLTHRVLGVDAYALMDAQNLRKLPFFRRFGAIGVELDDPQDGARATRYASRFVQESPRWLWIYAQGDERPITERPLAFKPGAAAVARLASHSVVLPLGLRYEFAGAERPEVHLAVGEVLRCTGEVEKDRRAQEDAVALLLDQIDERLRKKIAPAATELFHIHRPRWWSRLSERWLCHLTRGDIPPEQQQTIDRAG